MNKLFLIPALALAAGLSATAPALATPGEDYMAACMGASGDNTELCTCKTEQAVKLADEEMIGYLVMSLKTPAKFTEMVNKGEVPEAVTKKWGRYVLMSNKVCKPGE